MKNKQKTHRPAQKENPPDFYLGLIEKKQMTAKNNPHQSRWWPKADPIDLGRFRVVLRIKERHIISLTR